jgi:peptidylprolyl isomerase
MRQAKYGDTVKVHYTGKLKNGDVFSDTKDGEPLEFTLGRGSTIPGFEKAVIGMEIGETKTIIIPPKEGFGPRYEELVVEIRKHDLPDTIIPAVGEQLVIPQKGSDPIKVMVAGMNDDTVTLDGNHPLAGYTLIFTIQLVGVK